MFLASEPLAVLDLHHLSGSWMERIEDSHVERRTPGIVTLVRPAPARAGSPARSATRHAVTIDRCSTIACHACSTHLRWHAAMDAMYACSRASPASSF